MLIRFSASFDRNREKRECKRTIFYTDRAVIGGHFVFSVCAVEKDFSTRIVRASEAILKCVFSEKQRVRDPHRYGSGAVQTVPGSAGSVIHEADAEHGYNG